MYTNTVKNIHCSVFSICKLDCLRITVFMTTYTTPKKPQIGDLKVIFCFFVFLMKPEPLPNEVPVAIFLSE